MSAPALGRVTVLIPARNEERDIEACLACVAAQDWPVERIEIVVVDGGSSDGTAERARAFLAEHGMDGKIVENAIGSTPSNLNVGLAHATGTYLCRVDARSRIPTTYVSRCVEVLETMPGVKVVGGAQVALARDDTARSHGIARALNNRYAMGLSRYRRGAASGLSDTVYLGFFRTSEVWAAGGWDQALPTNQDFDLNQRLGGRSAVWFEAGIDVGYIPRATLRSLWQQYVRFGRWKVRYWRLSGSAPQPRQLALLAGPALAGIASVAVISRSRSPLRAVLLCIAGGISSLIALDAFGSSGPRTGLRGRLVGAVAAALVGAGWLRGVAGESLRGRRP